MKDKTNSSPSDKNRQNAEDTLNKKSIQNDENFSSIENHKTVPNSNLEQQNKALLTAKTNAEITAEKYSKLYDFAPFGYFTLSKKGIIENINLSGANLLEKDRSLLLKKRLSLFVSKETKPIFNIFLQEIFESKTKQTCEINLSITPDKSIQVSLSGIPCDNTIQCLISMQDISLYKKVETEKFLSEEKYRTLFESSRDSITIFRFGKDGKPGNFIEANPITTTLFGYSKKELLTMSVLDIEIISDKKRKARIKKLIANGKDDFETTIRTKKGSQRNVDVETIIINYLHKPAVMNITRDITERKQAEKNTQKAQENLTTILEAIPDLLFEVDTEGRIYYYQAHRQDLLAVPPTVFMGKSFSEVLPNEASKVCLAAIDESLKKGWSTGKKYALDLASGKHWFEISVSPIKESSDTNKHFIVLARDITDRIVAEEKVKTEKKRIDSILELVATPIFLKDNDHRISYANSAFCKLFKLNKKNIIGKTLVENLPKNEIEHFLKIDRNVLDTGIPDIREEELTIENQTHTIITSKTRFIDEAGNKMLVGSIYDVSKRKKAEEALQKSQEKLRGVFDLANSGIVLTDLKGKYLLFNNWFAKALGYTRGELNKLTRIEINHPDDLERSDAFFEKIVQGEIDRYQIEKRFVRKDKSFFWAEVSISAIKDKKGKTVNTIGIINDITERRIAKEKLKESEARLIAAQAVAKIGNWETDLTYTNALFSEEILKILGLTLDTTSISIEDFFAIVHPEDKTYVETKFVHSLKTNKINLLEHRIITPEGIEKFVEQRWEVLHDKTGAPYKVVGTTQDITERKLDEAKLKANTHLLNLTQSIANLGSYSFDFSTGKWTSSTVLDTIFGIDENFERSIESWISIIHPEWRSTMNYYLNNEVIAKKTNFNKEYKIIKIDSKEERWVHGLGEISFDKKGYPMQLIGSIQDITERKQAEQKLRIASEKFQDLVNSTGGIVWEADANTVIFNYVSQEAERLLGYPVEEWYEEGFWANHLHPDDKDRSISFCKSQTKLMKKHDFIYRFRAKDGNYIWLRDIVNVVVEDGKPRWLRGVMLDITAQIKTNESLIESEEKYRGLVENSPDAIVIYVEDKIAFINDEGLRMLKADKREDIIGKPVLQFIHPDSLEDIIKRMKEVTRDMNASDIVEEKFIALDGTPFDVEIKAIPTIYEDKSGVQVIVHDITNRKQTLLELNKINRVYALISQINNLILRSKNREELFHEICQIAVAHGKFRMSWIGILDKDEKTVNTAAFAGFEDGYFTEDHSNITILDEPGGRGPTGTAMREGRTVICNDIANDPIMKWIDGAIKRGYRSSITIPIIVLNKIIGAFNLYSEETNAFSSNEEVELLEKITQNIAFTLETILLEEDRKRTQDKIRQLSQAVEQSPVTIVITNTKGEIEYANPKFVETTGYTLEEVKNQNPKILKSGYTSLEEYNELWQTLNQGKDWHGEFHNKRKDGTLYWESASISPIVNSEGKTTHYIAIKEDITHRKEVEKKLLKSKERAEESDRLKLAFLANMSHEIRTPMNGILGFTELLKEPKLTGEEQQEYINIIEKSGKRMLNIINDIISISKVESGQVDIKISKTNINEQIEYIDTFFQPEAKHKGIQLFASKKLLPKDNLINTDQEKIYAILTNLVKNALKFTNEGSIEIGCVRKEENLEFFVKDTGLGITKSQKKIIFERFRQANESISRSHEGSGLGLAISKAYVEMLGGKIWVESKKGKGSAFYFTIPFSSEEKQEEEILVENKTTEAKNENKIKDLKVLIVEDDAISKLLITIAVKPYSKEIIKVSNGFEAIEACRNNPDIDLVMMDINMPEMGGYEATKHIREFNKDIVIIAQTANGMQSDRDNAIEAGCTDYISKPINIKTLSVLIDKYINKKL